MTALPRSSADQLGELLSEPIPAARRREARAFDDVAGDRSDRIVLVGAGGFGRHVLRGLRAAGTAPLAFIDNRRALWGCNVEGVPELAPDEAAERLAPDAVAVVTIWGANSPHRFEHSRDQLDRLGFDTIVPATWLCWRHHEQLLPYWSLDLPSHLLAQASRVRRCHELLDDERSREEYVAQVRWRLFGDPSVLSSPVADPQYFVADVALPSSTEVFLDCGAYDGDTLRSFLEARGASFARYVALEPDPASRRRLEQRVAALPEEAAGRVEVVPAGVAARTGTVAFSAAGSLSSSISTPAGAPAPGTGEIEIDCVALDDLTARLGDSVPTMVKIDIEGAELDALAGGSCLLRRHRPVVAIAAYHRQDHLWNVPLAIDETAPGYHYFFRPHNEQGWDLVCYAVPPGRVPPPAPDAAAAVRPALVALS